MLVNSVCQFNIELTLAINVMADWCGLKLRGRVSPDLLKHLIIEKLT